MRWKGYSERHDTWEPRAHLTLDLIREYKQKYALLQLHISFSRYCRQGGKEPAQLKAAATAASQSIVSFPQRNRLQSWDEVAHCPVSLLPPCLQMKSRKFVSASASAPKALVSARRCAGHARATMKQKHPKRSNLANVIPIKLDKRRRADL